MGDPLEPLFSRPTLKLFQGMEPVVSHGDIGRLPEWMRSAPLTTVAEVAEKFRGPLQIAQGRTSEAAPPDVSFVGEGGQTAVSGVKASMLLRLGLSVHFGSLDELIPSANDFLRAIERELAVPKSMRLSGFANAPGSGLPFHHDTHDQLLIHLIGNKKLALVRRRDVDHPRLSYSPSAPAPQGFEAVYRNGFSEESSLDDREVEVIELRPGSCVFMPAGTWHRTAGQEDVCLSLTTGVRSPSRWDLVREALRLWVTQSPEWRAPVYGSIEAHGERGFPEMQRLLANLGEKLPELNATDLRQALAITRLRDGDVASFPDVSFTHYIRLPSSSLREGFGDEDTVKLFIRTRQSAKEAEMTLGTDALAIVRHIEGTRAAFSVTELSERFDDFEEEDVSSLVRQLAQVGFLRPVFARRW